MVFCHSEGHQQLLGSKPFQKGLCFVGNSSREEFLPTSGDTVGKKIKFN